MPQNRLQTESGWYKHSMPDTEEKTLPLKNDEQRGTSFVQKSKTLLDHAFLSLKGNGLNELVEKYTDEVTTVLEGLSEDAELARKQVEELSTRVCYLEERLADEARQQNVMQRQLDQLTHDTGKRNNKQGHLSGILKQLTYITLIIAGAWVLTSVFQLIGR